MAQADSSIALRTEPVLIPLRPDLAADMRPATSWLVEEARLGADGAIDALQETGALVSGLGFDFELAQMLEQAPKGTRQWLRAVWLAEMLCVSVSGKFIDAASGLLGDDQKPSREFWALVMADPQAIQRLNQLVATDLAPVILAKKD